MPQKTMIWNGVALVERTAKDCNGCVFFHDDAKCQATDPHISAAITTFGDNCVIHNVIYVPAPAQPTASDAEWVVMKVAEVFWNAKQNDVSPSEHAVLIHNALLAAIARGRGE